jgi:MazG family protein
MSEPFDRLVGIMDRLRDPEGCPWDREQTLDSLAPYLLEEAYEVLDALGSGNGARLCEELGDLLLQIVFMARIASELGWFGVDDVCESISDKLVRRHPHVFGHTEVNGADEVVRNWEDIKKEERGSTAGSALDGVPGALPALLKAFRVTEKAAAVGFDWRQTEDVVGTLRSEVEELGAELESSQEVKRQRVREELGDVLLVMANLARHLAVEPETALQGATERFIRRFRDLEKHVSSSGRSVRDLPLGELDRVWERVKTAERST